MSIVGTDPLPDPFPIVPSGGLKNVIAISAGAYHCLALRDDGTVVAWGDNEFGQRNIPAELSNVVAISAGHLHSVALKADGTVVAWSRKDRDEATVPIEVRNVVSIAADDFHNLALIGNGPPVLDTRLENPKRTTAGFSVSLATQSGRVFRLEYKNSLADSNWTPLPLVAGNGRGLTLTDPTATESQRFYRVRRW